MGNGKEKTAVIVVQISDGQTVEIRCSRGEITVGRSHDCDLILPDPSVSRKHARIVGTGHGFFLEDMSTNGTFVNGEKVEKKTIVSDTDITIGPYLLHFKFIEPRKDVTVEVPTEVFSLGEKAPADECKRPVGRETADLTAQELGIVGKSAAIRELLARARKIARTDFPVLIMGETGTGKELIARAIHLLSPRSEYPYVALNCGAISPDLVESELFGHEKGAFTGAHAQRKGAFEIAQGGTLFLDEIGEMPHELQPKLLRTLEGHEIRRVGGNKTVKINVRIISATNRNLASDVTLGKFRRDLFYRLNSLPLHIPPLRDRIEDIPLLADHFLARYNEEYGESKKLTRKAYEILLSYPFPGNVRELKNLVQRAAVLTDGSKIDGHTISSLLSIDDTAPAEINPGLPGSGRLRKVDAYEREIIIRELQKTGWNKTQTAKNLGIAKSTLFDKIKRYRIITPDG